MDEKQTLETVSRQLLNSSTNHIERSLARMGLYLAGVNMLGWIYEQDITDTILSSQKFSRESKILASLIRSTHSYKNELEKSALLQ